MPVINSPTAFMLRWADGATHMLRAGLNFVDDEIASHPFVRDFANDTFHVSRGEVPAKMAVASPTTMNPAAYGASAAAASNAAVARMAAEAEATQKMREENEDPAAPMSGREITAEEQAEREKEAEEFEQWRAERRAAAMKIAQDAAVAGTVPGGSTALMASGAIPPAYPARPVRDDSIHSGDKVAITAAADGDKSPPPVPPVKK
jgi:hypothetical protein